jgi:tripartite-type tricarboxylate transporter receptor subunit TctC
MCHKKIILSSLLVGLCVFITTGRPGQAQSQVKYPTRAIDIIVPYAPGGSTDLSNRIVADFLKRKSGISLNIVNKPGGATIPACLEVYHARPDGYTLFGDNLTSVTLEISEKNLPFKVMDRTFIAMHSISPYAITVHPASPFNTLKDLLDELKRDPEHFTYVSIGTLAASDMMFRQACKVLGVNPLKAKPMVTRGAADAAVLTAGGNVKMGGGSISSQRVAIQAGMIRLLAMGGKNRWSEFPNVLSTSELGYPTLEADQWNGLSGPPHTPSYVVEFWEKTIQEMARDSEVISNMKNTGAIANYVNSTELRKYVLNNNRDLKELWDVK